MAMSQPLVKNQKALKDLNLPVLDFLLFGGSQSRCFLHLPVPRHLTITSKEKDAGGSLPVEKAVRLLPACMEGIIEMTYCPWVFVN